MATKCMRCGKVFWIALEGDESICPDCDEEDAAREYGCRPPFPVTVDGEPNPFFCKTCAHRYQPEQKGIGIRAICKECRRNEKWAEESEPTRKRRSLLVKQTIWPDVELGRN